MKEPIRLTKNKKILFIGKRLEAINAALQAGYDVYVLGFSKPKAKSKKYFEVVYSGNFKSLQHIEFDAVIPLTEKSVPLAYEFYTSRGISKPDLEKFKICHNKFEMKNHAQSQKVPVTEFFFCDTVEKVESCAARWGYPFVLKQIASSGSRGQLKIENKNNLPKKLEYPMLAEKWVTGKEFSVESLVFNGKIVFSNITEYYSHHHCNILPAPWEIELKNKIAAFNVHVIKGFGIQNGIVHMECFETPQGFVLGEIAVRPPGGYLMKLIELAYGFSPWRALIDIECGIAPTVQTHAPYFAGTWIIHPGQGTVEVEPNFLPIVNHPAVVDIKCGLKKGMKITERIGSGQDFGRILVKSKNSEEMYQVLDQVREILKTM